MTMIRGSNPIWFEVDLTAHAFDDTFYMFVLDNEIPYGPLPTWQDPFGNVVWDNPIRFLANGTLPNNIYFDPNTIYRLEFRQGQTQSDPLIYLVENYVPGIGENPPVDETSFITDNQITNPQFALINFTSPLTLSSISTQVINIAPGWFLNLTGTGSVTLTQVLINSTIVDPTNASYALQIQLSGWSNAYLSQRFTRNGVLWSNLYVSSSITALTGNVPQTISAILKDSQGAQTAIVLNPVSLTEEFTEYPDVGLVNPSTDTDLPPTAYIEYQLLLPNNCNITITSVQLVAGMVDLTYSYEQTTIERQIDNTFHIEQPKLNFKPIPSYLVGWNFALNPAQFFGTTVPVQAIGANACFYAWDQTLIFQTVNNGVSVSLANNGILLTAAQTGQMAIFQYLQSPVASYIALQRICSMITCASNTAPVNAIATMWYTTNANVPTPATTTFFTGLSSTGKPTGIASGWFEIPRVLGDNIFTIPTGNGSIYNNIALNGWNLNSGTIPQTIKFFAIVIGTSSIASGNQIGFQSISLNSGDIPTLPSPQTKDEVLRECQYYYEKSYPLNMFAGATTTLGSVVAFQNSELFTTTGVNANLYQDIVFLQFKQVKRVSNANIAIYSVNGVLNDVTLNIIGEDSGGGSGGSHVNASDVVFATYWTVSGQSDSSVYYTPVTVNLGVDLLSIAPNPTQHFIGTSAWMNFQYIIDARLGVV